MSLPQRQPLHQTSHPAYLRAGSASLTNLQALREASQRPWNPTTIVTGGTVTTGQLLSFCAVALSLDIRLALSVPRACVMLRLYRESTLRQRH